MDFALFAVEEEEEVAVSQSASENAIVPGSRRG